MAYFADPCVVGDIWQVRFIGSMFGQQVINTFYYRVEFLATAGSTFSKQGVLYGLMNVAGGLKEKFLACLPTGYVLTEVAIQKISPFRLIKNSNAEGSSGSSTYISNNQNVAQSIERRADLADKHSIGRISIPAPTEVDWVDSGLLTIAALTALSTLGSKMVALYGDYATLDTFAPVIVRKVAGVYTYRYLTVTVPQKTARVARRRTIGVGK